MNEKTVGRFNWWLPLYGLLGAAIVLLPKILLGTDNGIFLGVVALITVVPILIGIACLKFRRQSLAALSMLAVFAATFYLLFTVSDDVRRTGRWLILASRYKAEVLAQSNVVDGELKHAEWDSWGFAGVANTVDYLVFDPDDSLAAAAKSGSPGKFSGIPCAVLRVRRVESQWYTVLYYSDEVWNRCS